MAQKSPCRLGSLKSVVSRNLAATSQFLGPRGYSPGRMLQCLQGGFRSTAIVGLDEPYIIAINSRRIRIPIVDLTAPYIVKSVFPIGNLAVFFDTHDHNIVDSHHIFRDHIQKKSGSTVSTNVFLDSRYAGISSVLYSGIDATNHSQPLGIDFKLVHNPLAQNSLPFGFFKFGTEYWYNEKEIKYRLWT